MAWLYFSVRPWDHGTDHKRTDAAGFNHHLVEPVSSTDFLQILDEFNPRGD